MTTLNFRISGRFRAWRESSGRSTMEVWEIEEILKVQEQLKPYGFCMDVVESVNVHDEIKTGGANRELYIENYIKTIRNLKEFGVKVICYNFMPVFDWTRTELFHPMKDGSTALYYEAAKIRDNPKEMADRKSVV